jgi:uncharacterized RDD family membrane protein YckC
MRDAQLIETEETLIIETPERVPLAFALASIGNRFLAVAIDHTIQYLAIFFAAWIFLSASGIDISGPLTDPADLPGWVIAVMIIVLFVLFAGYFILFEWLMDGQTPGKRLLKLRVIREDGRPVTLWEAVARNLLRIFDAAPGFLVPVYSVGLLVIFLNRRDQRVGDLFAGTVVIRERRDEAPTFRETFLETASADSALRRAGPPAEFSADISRLTAEEIEVVESFLRRRWKLADRQREWMAWRIALPIMFKLKPQYNSQTFTYEGFLEGVLERYSARQRFLN